MLLKPGERLKLCSIAALLIGFTTSFRPSHPSPKLSNSCTLTRAVACGASGTDGGGVGCSCNGGGLTGGLEGSGAEGGGEGAEQTRTPKAASIKLAARISLMVTRARSESVSESLSGTTSSEGAKRATNASRSSAAVRCVGLFGGSSHSLTTSPFT